MQSRTDVLSGPGAGPSGIPPCAASRRTRGGFGQYCGRTVVQPINVIIARHAPNLADSVARTFALAEAAKLRSLFDKAGFGEFATDTIRHVFVLPSFDAYYGPFERGGGSTGQALAELSEELRRCIREEVRGGLGDTGGPVKPEAEYRIASGKR